MSAPPNYGNTPQRMIQQVRRGHRAAKPKPSVNPAWANSHVDIALLLQFLDYQIVPFLRDVVANGRHAGRVGKAEDLLEQIRDSDSANPQSSTGESK